MPNVLAKNGNINFEKMQTLGSLLHEIHIFQHQVKNSLPLLPPPPIINHEMLLISHCVCVCVCVCVT